MKNVQASIKCGHSIKRTAQVFLQIKDFKKKPHKYLVNPLTNCKTWFTQWKWLQFSILMLADKINLNGWPFNMILTEPISTKNACVNTVPKNTSCWVPIVLNPLDTKSNLNDIQFSSHHAVNTLCPGYKYQSVNAVKGNNHCLFWDPYETHNYKVLAECGITEC